MVGVSFGGFFAPIAAAADPRFRNVGLLYTGGELHRLIVANVDGLPPAATALGAELAVLRFQRLEPTRYLARIAPRPVLIVNGLFDDQIPRRSAQALYDAARPPRELVDTAFSRLPLLGGG